MLRVDNFNYGALTPLLASVISWLGTLTGLRCASRARAYEGPARAFWLLLAAASIGMMGVWVMHFIALLGFTIRGTPIRYNVPAAILSMLVAVAVVAVGLFIAGCQRGSSRNLLLAGMVTGAGIAATNFAGLAAMRMDATMSFDPLVAGLSVIIAMTAATTALWFTERLRGMTASLGASLIMAAAVTGMHYTAMAAVRVWPAAGDGQSTGGVTSTSLLVPLVAGIILTLFVLVGHVALAPAGDDILAEAKLAARLRAHGMEI
jgi:NO-binding membrane sensor protein with MHYT domain